MIEEDITKQKQKTLKCQRDIRKLKNAKSYLENIVGNFPASVYWKNKKGHILGDNLIHAQMAGFQSQADVIGKTDFDFPWKKQAQQIRKNDLQVMKSKKTETFEEIGSLNADSTNIFLTIKTPLLNRFKKVSGVIGISMDITDRKKMENDLQIAKEKAEAANYIMTEFISNMGHILVTPFSTITGVATMLLYGYSDKYLELKPLFEELMQGCTDWEKAYSQIIKATSITEVEVKTESFSIQNELHIIRSIMEPAAVSKNLKLIIHPFEHKNQDLIETDKLKFHLILIELISNAIKFTEKGQITISIEKENGWYNIQVEDTGIGIPADKLDFIFEQYTMLSRAQKHGANFKGVGAGLFLAKQRAKLLDARIFVSSEFSKGSTFTLSIPVCPIKNS